MRPVKLVTYDLDRDQGGAIAVEENETEVASFRKELHQWLQGIREGKFEAGSNPRGARPATSPGHARQEGGRKRT
jgi:hypothetical protein